MSETEQVPRLVIPEPPYSLGDVVYEGTHNSVPMIVTGIEYRIISTIEHESSWGWYVQLVPVHRHTSYAYPFSVDDISSEPWSIGDAS